VPQSGYQPSGAPRIGPYFIQGNAEQGGLGAALIGVLP
jgi:hypothetical protein